MMPVRVRRGAALAVLLAAAVAVPLSYGADAPLSPQASAFKAEGIPDCISNYLHRGIEYEPAQVQCECVFDFYARNLTPHEMSAVSAMSKSVHAKRADPKDPVIIAGADALMRVNPELMQSCKLK